MIRFCSRRSSFPAARAAVLLAVAPLAMHAQGGISGLGFGYPVASGSTRSNGAAGAFSEFDALSPINPASPGGVQRMVLSAQAEPELRTLTLDGVRERNTVPRVPLLIVVFPVGRGAAVSLSGTSFLDRTFSTSTIGNVNIAGGTVRTTDITEVRGAIGDLRAAVGWSINPRVKVGLGGHLFTGENTAARQRTFTDTLQFGSVLDSSRVTFFGTALSVGSEVEVGKGIAVSGSYRLGNTLDSRVRDTVRTKASVPDRLGFGVRYSGIPGSIFSISVEQISWSQISSLGSSQFVSRDATNWNAGVELAGPRLRGSPLLVRAGYAMKELPFGTTALRAKESRFAAGIGLPVARESASIDLSVQRANRALTGSNAKEGAWLLGIGVQIRP